MLMKYLLREFGGSVKTTFFLFQPKNMRYFADNCNYNYLI